MLDARRKRLIYRANYRGFKEADLILGGYAKANVETMSDADLAMFEDLLSAKDHDIYAWITGTLPVPIMTRLCSNAFGPLILPFRLCKFSLTVM